MSLSIHPGGRRLLVHCRSLSTPVIMIDLKLHTIMQTFMGSQSFKNRVSSCITPCGTYVISSSQDGAVYVWNADNGQQVNRRRVIGQCNGNFDSFQNLYDFKNSGHNKVCISV